MEASRARCAFVLLHFCASRFRASSLQPSDLPTFRAEYPMKIADGQGGYRVRFDWGPLGADAVAPGAAFVAVVDVLSFPTTLPVAVERGLSVLPSRWRASSAVAFARRHGAALAVLRSQSGPGQ